jgi:hypothetical protein
MNSLAILWQGEGGVESGSESGVLNFVLQSQALLASEGVTYSQASVVIILFSRCSICFVLRNYKFVTVFLW